MIPEIQIDGSLIVGAATLIGIAVGLYWRVRGLEKRVALLEAWQMKHIEDTVDIKTELARFDEKLDSIVDRLDRMNGRND